MFFVSVASKELRQAVSLLFATLARRSISVAGKGLKVIAGIDSGKGRTGVNAPTRPGSPLHNCGGVSIRTSARRNVEEESRKGQGAGGALRPECSG